MNKSYLTVKEFLNMLEASTQKTQEELFQNGAITTKEMLNENCVIARRDIARIIHECLRLYLNETDEADWSAALDLRDIYDCHTCVGHIAQVYSKGIMEAVSKNTFGSKEGVSREEGQLILSRMLDNNKRIIPKRRPVQFQKCSYKTLEGMDTKQRLVIVDVRDEDTFINKPLVRESLNIPLSELNKNPYVLAVDLNTPVYVICERGYQSAMAAEILIRSGYRNINVIER